MYGLKAVPFRKVEFFRSLCSRTLQKTVAGVRKTDLTGLKALA
jgi:hypothetical protein